MPVQEYRDVNVGVATQLGSDLTIGSSGGWPNNSSPFQSGYSGSSYLDGNPVTTNFNSGFWPANNAIDMCFHGGDLYVVWVEPIVTGDVANSPPANSRAAMGPYVKKWNGSSWVSVGASPIETQDHHVAWNYNNANYGTPFDTTVGHVYLPSRPRIASDGVDIYIAYAIKVVQTAPDHPPVGAWVPGNANTYRVASGDYTKYDPRNVRVMKWNGSAWVLYGEAPAGCYNSYDNDSVRQPGGNYSTYINLAANVATPGEVAVGFWERGPTSPTPTWLASPSLIGGILFGTFTYSPERARAVVTLFDGSDTIGTTRNISDYNMAQSTNTFAPTINSDDFYAGMADAAYGHNIAFNSAGDLMIFKNWSDRMEMIEFAGGTVLQTYTYGSPDFLYPSGAAYTSDIGQMPAIGYDSVRQMFILNIGEAYNQVMHIGEVAEDGSSAFADFRNDLGDYTAPNNLFRDKMWPVLDSDEVWAASRFNAAYNIVYFHENCPAWENKFYSSDPNGGALALRNIGDPAGVLDDAGDNFYEAALFYVPGNTSADVKVRVYKWPILDDQGGCGVDSGSVDGKCKTAVLTGQVFPGSNPGDNRRWYFEWGTTTSYGNTTTGGFVSGFEGVTVVQRISGLTPGVTYHYRVVLVQIIDDVETPEYGDDVSWTESPCPQIYLHTEHRIGQPPPEL